MHRPMVMRTVDRHTFYSLAFPSRRAYTQGFVRAGIFTPGRRVIRISGSRELYTIATDPPFPPPPFLPPFVTPAISFSPPLSPPFPPLSSSFSLSFPIGSGEPEVTRGQDRRDRAATVRLVHEACTARFDSRTACGGG